MVKRKIPKCNNSASLVEKEVKLVCIATTLFCIKLMRAYYDFVMIFYR